MAPGVSARFWKLYWDAAGPVARSEVSPLWAVELSLVAEERGCQPEGYPLLNVSKDPFCTRFTGTGVAVAVGIGVLVAVAVAVAVVVAVGVHVGVTVAVGALVACAASLHAKP